MLEIIKLAKLYKLDSLFKACESHFKELMVQNFDCTNLITLKTNGSSKKKEKEEQVRIGEAPVSSSSRAPGGRAPQQVSQGQPNTNPGQLPMQVTGGRRSRKA